MTAQEQEMIDGLVQRIRGTQVNDKDVQAEQYLQQGLAGYPDATYVLAQTVLVQQYGLQQAQQQIQQLQSQVTDLQAQIEQVKQQAAQHPSGGSFLSHLFGGGQQAQGSQAAQPSPAYAQQPPYQPVNNPGYPVQQGYPSQAGYPPQQVYAQPVYVQQQPMGYAPMGMGGGGGFLRGALQTAAGVAAGEFVFDELFHGFGGERGGGGFGGGERPEEIINNNYYGDGGGERGHHETSQGDGSFYNPDHDASRENFSGGDSQKLADGGDQSAYDSQNDDDSAFSDPGDQDSGDQGSGDSGYDDSGSGFDSGDSGGGGDDSSY